ncbi:unnamed protein product [Soboliphyme baturini]|uniref:BZIP domain-containing protein n=1 Tax=Soboliphyme baturini TaxID=241478 RepID=A0A183IP12_9BILA|nr:unnamed protein product [Soboliphyme baturini]
MKVVCFCLPICCGGASVDLNEILVAGGGGKRTDPDSPIQMHRRTSSSDAFTQSGVVKGAEVDKLLAERKRWQDEVDRLDQQKMDLEFLLKNHEQMCPMHLAHVTSGGGGAGGGSNGETGVRTNDRGGVLLDVVKSNKDPPLTMVVLSNDSGKNASDSQDSNDCFISRPNTLNISMSMTSPGIPMETPSKIFPFDPLNAPTGLTPITHTDLTPMLVCSTPLTLVAPTPMDVGSVVVSKSLSNL